MYNIFNIGAYKLNYRWVASLYSYTVSCNGEHTFFLFKLLAVFEASAARLQCDMNISPPVQGNTDEREPSL